MEIRKRKVMINKAGGTAGKNSVNYRISLPAPWVKKIGINENDRNVILEFDGSKIVITKAIDANGERGWQAYES